MKKLNKKGFTLIELLAVIIILGVLLLIAVPRISKYITSSRIDTYETNISNLIGAVNNEVNSYSNEDYQFKSTEILVVPFVCIELDRGSNTKSPFGEYEEESSFVVVTRKMDGEKQIGYTYYATANDNKAYGAALAEESSIAVTGIATVESKITYANDKYSVTLDSEDIDAKEAAKSKKLITCAAFKTAMGDTKTTAGYVIAE